MEEWTDIPVKAYDDGAVDVAGVRTRVPTPRAPAHRDKLVAPIAALCDYARRLPEVRAIAEAQDGLAALEQPLRSDIALERAVETVYVAADCPICDRNLGIK